MLKPWLQPWTPYNETATKWYLNSASALIYNKRREKAKLVCVIPCRAVILV